MSLKTREAAGNAEQNEERQSHKKGVNRRVIATRSYDLQAGGTAIAEIYSPEIIDREEWHCLFVIRGLKNEIREAGIGVDSMQALQGIRYYLERCGETCWSTPRARIPTMTSGAIILVMTTTLAFSAFQTPAAPSLGASMM